MKKNAILLTTLAARLERAIHADVGMKGLKILLYGWSKKTKFFKHSTMRMRKVKDGKEWLTWMETLSFSRYVGCDLTRD